MFEKYKNELTEIFKYYGLDLSTGIKMYLKVVQYTKIIQLQLKPITKLDQVINEACNKEFVGSYSLIQDFEKALNDEG